MPKNYETLQIKGSCIVTARDVRTRKVLSENRYFNTLLTNWKEDLVLALANITSDAAPQVMAFSRDLVASSPVPTSLGDNEFRDSITSFQNESTLIMLSTLSAGEGNTLGAGTIKSIGFYYGADATTSTGTGTLGSLINTLSETKNPTIELTFQYEIAFS